jgi:isoleucyl-tRNA synthetase
LSFKESDVDEVVKKFITTLRNVFSFYGLYKEHDDMRAPKGEHALDAWILARLGQTLAQETAAMESYDIQEAARTLQPFVTDLSTWYVRRSRDRMKTDGEDQKEALATLRAVLETFSKMLAPFMPFLAEMLYQELAGHWSGEEGRTSVHLELWPELGAADESILTQMGEVRSIVSRILDARIEAGVPIKQVLGSVKVSVPTGAMSEALQAVILDEVNMKAMEVTQGDLAVVVDFTLTPELMREGMVRDLTRHINQMRKDAGKTIQDRIDLKVWSESEEVKVMFDEHAQMLKDDVLAATVTFEAPCEGAKAVRVREHEVQIGF